MADGRAAEKVAVDMCSKKEDKPRIQGIGSTECGKKIDKEEPHSGVNRLDNGSKRNYKAILNRQWL